MRFPFPNELRFKHRIFDSLYFSIRCTQTHFSNTYPLSAFPISVLLSLLTM